VGAAKRLLGYRYSQADAADGRIVLVLDADQYRAYFRRFRGHVAAKGGELVRCGRPDSP
jgi:hypothetical protein